MYKNIAKSKKMILSISNIIPLVICLSLAIFKNSEFVKERIEKINKYPKPEEHRIKI